MPPAHTTQRRPIVFSHPLDQFRYEFDLSEVCLRLFENDPDGFQSPAVFDRLFNPLISNLRVCQRTWSDLVRRVKLGPESHGALVFALERLGDMIEYPWPQDRHGPIYDILCPLTVEVVLDLADLLGPPRPGVDDSKPREAVRAHLRRWCDAAGGGKDSPYPIVFREQLREVIGQDQIGQHRHGTVQTIVDRFDPRLLADLNKAYIRYLTSLPNGDGAESSRRVRAFLDADVLRHWAAAARCVCTQARVGEFNDLVAAVLPGVFEAINRCQGHEPLDLLVAVVKYLGLLHGQRTVRFRQGLLETLQGLHDGYLEPWRERAKNDRNFRRGFYDAMETLRPALAQNGRPRQSARMPMPPEFRVRLIPEPKQKVDVPFAWPEADFVEGEVVDLSQQLQGILIRIRADVVFERGDDVWFQFPGSTRPDGAWVVLPYAQPDGQQLGLATNFKPRWHKKCEDSDLLLVGGELQLRDRPDALQACCDDLSNQTNHAFSPDRGATEDGTADPRRPR